MHTTDDTSDTFVITSAGKIASYTIISCLQHFGYSEFHAVAVVL